RGASELLKDTSVVICEADIDDFGDLNAVLEERGFVIFDITGLAYAPDGTLGWFYPVYINRSLASIRSKAFWNARDNDSALQTQIKRRKSILEYNAETLARIRSSTGQKLGDR